MCGRFTLKTPAPNLAEAFGLPEIPDVEPRYNIAPTQNVAVIRAGADGRRLDWLRWGLIPAWTKDASRAPLHINARVDTLLEKPSFRGAFRSRRCLVPADGFFEWQTVNGKKQPMYFTLDDGRPFAMAGLWERWEGPDGQVIESCTTLTTESNDVVGSVHDRMPVILSPSDYARWLDPRVTDPRPLLPLLGPYPAERMQVRAVDPKVNSARAEGPACIAPAPQVEELRLF